MQAGLVVAAFAATALAQSDPSREVVKDAANLLNACHKPAFFTSTQGQQTAEAECQEVFESALIPDAAIEEVGCGQWAVLENGEVGTTNDSRSRYVQAMKLASLQMLQMQNHAMKTDEHFVYGTEEQPLETPQAKDLQRGDLEIFRSLRERALRQDLLIQAQERHATRANYEQHIINDYLFSEMGRQAWMESKRQAKDAKVDLQFSSVVNRIKLALSSLPNIAIIDGEERVFPDVVPNCTQQEGMDPWTPPYAIESTTSFDFLDGCYQETREPFASGACGLTHYCIDITEDIIATLDSDVNSPVVQHGRLAQLYTMIQVDAELYMLEYDRILGSMPALHVPLTVGWHKTLFHKLAEPRFQASSLATETIEEFAHDMRIARAKINRKIAESRTTIATYGLKDAPELGQFLDIKARVLQVCPSLEPMATLVEAEPTRADRQHTWSNRIFWLSIPLMLAGPGVFSGIASKVLGVTITWTPRLLYAFGMFTLFAPMTWSVATEYTIYKHYQSLVQTGFWYRGLLDKRVQDAQYANFLKSLSDLGKQAAVIFLAMPLLTRVSRATLPVLRNAGGWLYGNSPATVQRVLERAYRVSGNVTLAPLRVAQASKAKLRAVLDQLRSPSSLSSVSVIGLAQVLDNYPNAERYMLPADPREPCLLSRDETASLLADANAGFVGQLTEHTLPNLAKTLPPGATHSFRYVVADDGLWLLSENATQVIREQTGQSNPTENCFIGQTPIFADGWLDIKNINGVITIVNGTSYGAAIPTWLAEARGMNRPSAAGNNPDIFDVLPLSVAVDPTPENWLNLVPEKGWQQLLATSG